MRIKHSLRYCFILLALATTGLFADAATTAPAATHAAGIHKSSKVAKNGHRKHRHHRRHRRQRG